MYREPGEKPPKPEGEKPSLEDLAEKGAGLRRSTEVSAMRQEEEAQKAARDTAAAELRLNENTYVTGRAPLSQLLVVAGTAGIVLLAAAPLVLWKDRHYERSPGDVSIGLLLLAVAVAMGVVGRAWRRRVLARTYAYLRSFPYPITGFFNVFATDWRPTSRTETYPFGRVTLHVKLVSAVEGEHRLADALAAVAPGTLTVTADRVQITSEPFLGGSDAHAWFTRVIEQFVPALHEVHSVAKISLTQRD